MVSDSADSNNKPAPEHTGSETGVLTSGVAEHPGEVLGNVNDISEGNTPTSEDDKSQLHSLSTNGSLTSLSSSQADNRYNSPVQFRQVVEDGRGSVASQGRSSFSTSIDSNRLRRELTGHSVKEIYGDMTEEQIMLHRTQSKKSVMKTLSERLDKPEIYDDVPDIPMPVKDFGAEFQSLDPELITWDGIEDPAYPRNWSRKDKLMQMTVVSLYTLLSPMSSSVSSPATPYISKQFGITSSAVQALTVSIMVLAFAIGPLIIAPISESDRIGRKPVLNASIWILFIFNLCCAFTKSTAQLCVLRFLGGLGGCAALNVGAGTIADLYNDRSRNVALAVYSICPSLGPVISPIMSGFVVMHLDWPWVFYIIAIFNGAVAIFGTIVFKETYSPKLLHDKAKRLRKETGNEHLHTIFEITAKSTLQIIKTTVLRPLRLLTMHPMVIGLGAYMAFTYGFMYLMLVTFPTVFQGSYGFTSGISGLMFISLGIGYGLGIFVWTYFVGHIYDVLTARNNGIPKPEYRLPCLIASGIGIPIGLIWYGWSVDKGIHWIMPCIGSGIFAFSFIAVFQTIQNYLIDMNPRFAASSIAAGAVFRSLFGFLFPLFGNLMYDKLGYGWGNTMCAFIALALGIPFPLFCFKYGERMRLWANRRLEEDQLKTDNEVINQKLDDIERDEERGSMAEKTQSLV